MLALMNEPLIAAGEVPKTTDETDSDGMYAPPAPPPKKWGPWLVQQLDPKMYEILCANKVPYFILKSLADEDWGDISLLLSR